MKKKSLLIVSGTGKPVLSITVNSIIWVALTVVAVIGVVAYFIPAEAFHLSGADLRHQQDLGRQNEVLHRRISVALQLLDRAKEQINRLGQKKEKVSSLLPEAQPDSGTRKGRPARSNGRSARSAPRNTLGMQIARIGSVFGAYGDVIDQGKNPFERIPILRPVPNQTVIFRHFCTERDPFSGRMKKHQGVDIAAPPGTPVIAAAAGVVSAARADAVWGKRIVVDHGNGFHTVYAHLGSIEARSGQKVKRGGTLGTIGSSGFTTGPHVHYEIWRGGKAMDPEKYFFPTHSPAI